MPARSARRRQRPMLPEGRRGFARRAGRHPLPGRTPVRASPPSIPARLASATAVATNPSESARITECLVRQCQATRPRTKSAYTAGSISNVSGSQSLSLLPCLIPEDSSSSASKTSSCRRKRRPAPFDGFHSVSSPTSKYMLIAHPPAQRPWPRVGDRVAGRHRGKSGDVPRPHRGTGAGDVRWAPHPLAAGAGPLDQAWRYRCAADELLLQRMAGGQTRAEALG